MYLYHRKAVGAYFDTLDEMISDKRIDEVKKGNVKVSSQMTSH